jgi:hypothetical protein
LVAEPVTICCHLPKTAGTTLNSILTRQYHRRHRLYDAEAIAAFPHRPTSELLSLQLVTGHVSYGLHRHVPRACVYVTFLRDPVARVVSLYRHARRHSNHYLHDDIGRRGMTLREFVRCDEAFHETHNGQTSALAGLLNARRVTPRHLLQAVWNLRRHFPVVGITEEFDASVVLMQRALGWRRLPLYTRENVAPRGGAEEFLTPDVAREVAAANSLDIALYRWARRRLHRQTRRAGQAFEDHLAAFHAANGEHQRGVGRADEAVAV